MFKEGKKQKSLLIILALDFIIGIGVYIYIDQSINQMVHEHQPIARPSEALGLR